ncbi:hypothetical protein NAI39_09670, partial [Francisella tularensis subsp. holarctica]|nr:hypothetical protein [Francisella tularensis subsp. holarctica]
HNIIKENHNINQDYKKSQNYYKSQSAKDYIDENVKKYNSEYKIKNYKNHLDNISTPEEIDKSFEQIDDDDEVSQGFKYKLSDGYPIEQ